VCVAVQLGGGDVMGCGWPEIPYPVTPQTETCLGFHMKSPLLLSDFNENRNVLTNFNKTSQY
jgi:hypothetical protein